MEVRDGRTLAVPWLWPFWIVPIQTGVGASNGCHTRRASVRRHGPWWPAGPRRHGFPGESPMALKRGTRKRNSSPSCPRTRRFTVCLPQGLLNRLRNTVYWVPRLTLTHFVEGALTVALHRLEAAHGGPFPRRMEELKPGRPKRSSTRAQTAMETPDVPAPGSAVSCGNPRDVAVTRGPEPTD